MSLSPLVRAVEEAQLRDDRPELEPGDTVRVHLKVVEGTRERIQVFEGSATPGRHCTSPASGTRRTILATSCPDWRNAADRLCPISPDAPLIRTRMTNPPPAPAHTPNGKPLPY